MDQDDDGTVAKRALDATDATLSLVPAAALASSMADTAASCTPASVAARLAELSSDEVAAALENADLPPESLAAINMAVAVAIEAAHKRRRMALDIRTDALGRMGTIQTMIRLRFGRHAGSLVCRRWRDASRGLALNGTEHARLVKAATADHTNPHLMANLDYYDIRALTFEGEEDDDAITAVVERCRTNVVIFVLIKFGRPLTPDVIAAAASCRDLIGFSFVGSCESSPQLTAAIVNLAENCRKLETFMIMSNCATDDGIAALAKCHSLKHFFLTSTNVTSIGITALAEGCQLTDIILVGCTAITDNAVAALAEGCPKLARIALSGCTAITDNAATALAAGCPELADINLAGCTAITDNAVTVLVEGCAKLTHINLYDTAITDAAITALQNSSAKLKKVHFSRGAGLSQEATRALREAHGGVEISHSRGQF